MKKLQSILVLLVVLIALLLIIPNQVNAAEDYIYKDEEQGIEWSYKLDENDNVINLKCETKDATGKITIPSTIDGKEVISIGGKKLFQVEGIFQDCSGITEVIIPNTITVISEKSFSNCSGLKSVSIPDNVTNIESYAFDNCAGLSNIDLPENLIQIGVFAFADCTGLKSVTIPNGVTIIEDGAFSGCSGIKELKLSDNLSSINENVFKGCTGLTSVIIPDSVTSINSGDYDIYGAFKDCKNLTKILIPDSVTSIADQVFSGCDNLTIYGNEGSMAQSYAKEHDIPFDYISNWDNSDSGKDITPPIVKSIEVSYSSILSSYDKDTSKNLYMIPADVNIVINVNFSENIKGTQVPKLTIKFGSGENIDLTEGTIGESTISYEYTIKNTDKGILTSVDFSGGNITDKAGNAATLSCPKLVVENDGEASVYANGTSTKPNGTNDENNNDDKNNTNSNTNNTNNSNKTDGKEDNTTAPGKLPQTGVSILLSATILVVLTGGIIAFIKYRKLKGI